MLIGVCGYARSGKDTVGDILVEKGFARTAFADPMRDGLYALNPWIPIEIKIEVPPTHLFTGQQRSEFRMRRLQEMVDESGWDVAKEVPEVRRLLQRYGTEAGRGIHGEDVWVDALISRWANDGFLPTVVTDVRFINEASAIQRVGGEVWRIERPGVGPANDHSSETELDSIRADATILNDGTLDALRVRVEANLKIALR